MMDEEAVDYFPPAHNIYESQSLPDDLFQRWWQMLATEDREEFRHFYGGDAILARFVCVLDYLIMQKVEGKEENIFALAYYIAAKPYPEAVTMNSASCRTRSQKAWQHPATQALMDRVKYRATRGRILRTENLLFRNVEKMLEDSHKTRVDQDGNEVPEYNMKDRNFAAMVAVKAMELAQRGEAEIIATRTKLGLENARKALSQGQEEVDPNVAAGYAKMLLDSVGPEKFAELMKLNP